MDTAVVHTKEGQVGLHLTALIRNILNADAGCDWQHAVRIGASIERSIREADWVRLDNGDELVLKPL